MDGEKEERMGNRQGFGLCPPKASKELRLGCADDGGEDDYDYDEEEDDEEQEPQPVEVAEELPPPPSRISFLCCRIATRVPAGGGLACGHAGL